MYPKGFAFSARLAALTCVAVGMALPQGDELTAARQELAGLEDKVRQIELRKATTQRYREQNAREWSKLESAFNRHLNTFDTYVVPAIVDDHRDLAKDLKAMERKRVDPKLREPTFEHQKYPSKLFWVPSLSPIKSEKLHTLEEWCPQFARSETELEAQRGGYWSIKDAIDRRIANDTDTAMPGMPMPHNVEDLIAQEPALQEMLTRTQMQVKAAAQKVKTIETARASAAAASQRAALHPEPAAPPPVQQPTVPPPPAVDVNALLARVAVFEGVVTAEENAQATLRDQAVAACVDLNAKSYQPAAALQTAHAALNSLRALAGDVQAKAAICASFPIENSKILAQISNIRSYEETMARGFAGARIRARSCTSETTYNEANELYFNSKKIASELVRKRLQVTQQRADLEQAMEDVKNVISNFDRIPGLRAALTGAVARYDESLQSAQQLVAQVNAMEKQLDQRRKALPLNFANFRSGLPSSLPAEVAPRVAALESRVNSLPTLAPCQAAPPAGAPGDAQSLVAEGDRLISSARTDASSCPALELSAAAGLGVVTAVANSDILDLIAACRAKLDAPKPADTDATGTSTSGGFSTQGGENKPAKPPDTGFSDQGGRNVTPPQPPSQPNTVDLLGAGASSEPAMSAADRAERDRLRRTLNDAMYTPVIPPQSAAPDPRVFDQQPQPQPQYVPMPDPEAARREREQKMIALMQGATQILGQYQANRQRAQTQQQPPPLPQPQMPNSGSLPQLPPYQGIPGYPSPTPSPPVQRPATQPAVTPPIFKPTVPQPTVVTPPVVKPTVPPPTVKPTVVTPPPATPNCLQTKCSMCSADRQITLLGRTVAADCERCKQRYCPADADRSKNWLKGDYCVFQVTLGNRQYRNEMFGCDSPRKDMLVFGPDSQLACENFINGKR